MSVSSILEILLLTEAQSQKATATNYAIGAMEQALAAKLELDTSTATVAGFDLYIPFDDGGDLTDRDALRFMYLDVQSGATQNFDVWHPNNPHLFIIKNGTTKIITLKCYDADTLIDTGGTQITIAAGAFNLVYCDGENFYKTQFNLDTITQANDIHIQFFGMPEALQPIARALIGRETTFPANFAGAIGHCTVNPLTTHVFDVKDDATTIGTISISTGGVFTFATTSGTAKVVAANSFLTITEGATPDTLLDTLEIYIPGTVVITQ